MKKVRFEIKMPLLVYFETLCLVVVMYYVYIIINRKYNLLHIPGPCLLPFLGNALLFAGDHLHFLPVMKKLIGMYEKKTRLAVERDKP